MPLRARFHLCVEQGPHGIRYVSFAVPLLEEFNSLLGSRHSVPVEIAVAVVAETSLEALGWPAVKPCAASQEQFLGDAAVRADLPARRGSLHRSGGCAGPALLSARVRRRSQTGSTITGCEEVHPSVSRFQTPTDTPARSPAQRPAAAAPAQLLPPVLLQHPPVPVLLRRRDDAPAAVPPGPRGPSPPGPGRRVRRRRRGSPRRLRLDPLPRAPRRPRGRLRRGVRVGGARRGVRRRRRAWWEVQGGEPRTPLGGGPAFRRRGKLRRRPVEKF